MPDENRPSWRPQDEQHRARRALSEEDDRYEEERYGRHWEDRGERYGVGQSGYAAGRYEGDRSLGFESRNQGYPGSFEDRHRERGLDERFSGRGGSAYYERGYGYNDRGGYGERGRGWEAERSGERPNPNLGTGGAMHGGQSSSREHWSAREGATGYSNGHRGKGPAGYQRSDERIREIVCEALTDDDRIDASNIEVAVKGGEVTLSGSVKERSMKRAAEELVEGISGVKDVQNQIRYRS